MLRTAIGAALVLIFAFTTLTDANLCKLQRKKLKKCQLENRRSCIKFVRKVKKFCEKTDQPKNWLPVQSEDEDFINVDLENNKSLWIKTNSELGSGDNIYVYFRNPEMILSTGGIEIRFHQALEYRLRLCHRRWNVFPTTPPTTKDKVWKITLDKTESIGTPPPDYVRVRVHSIRIIVHCNGVKVLDMYVTDDTCADGSPTDRRLLSGWYYYWSKSQTIIQFNFMDTASDYYWVES